MNSKIAHLEDTNFDDMTRDELTRLAEHHASEWVREEAQRRLEREPLNLFDILRGCDHCSAPMDDDMLATYTFVDEYAELCQEAGETAPAIDGTEDIAAAAAKLMTWLKANGYEFWLIA